MIATRSLPESSERGRSDEELRRCVRDLVALSSLPALWIRADGRQIAESVCLLVVSLLDADFAWVFLRDPELELVHRHQRLKEWTIEPRRIRERYRPNSTFEIEEGDQGPLRATCVPIGKEVGSGLIVASRRQDFPTDTEQTLLRVAANQAAVAIQRWKSEALVAEQARDLEELKDVETALYALTDRLFRAESETEVYEAGLDAILRILHCDRASILLFDRQGVMRFAAWRGLSDEYRAAVDGHSPWKPQDSFAEPICVEDVEAAKGLSDEVKGAVLRENIGALAFIPIFVGAQVAGKFMAYYDVPQMFAQREIEAGTAIARQLGFGLERQRAEETRRRLAAIVEMSDDAIISKNLDGVIQTWNRGAASIFGYTTDEVLGKPVTILMPPERYDEEPAILARLRRGERIEHYQTVRRRKDGSLVDVSLAVSPIRDAAGRVVAASKVARDITEQKRAEAALRDSERRLQDLIAAIPAAIYTTDASGKITYYNEAAVEFAGRRPTIGNDEWSVSWKMYWPDGTPLPHNQCPMAQAIKEDRPIRGKELIAERPDGTRIPYIPFPTPLHDVAGKLIGAINILVDVSERRQAETQQRVLMRELNHRVKNNMQLLQSLLFAATRQTQNLEARRVLEDVTNRITAMAAAQRVLYGADTGHRFGAAELVEAVCLAAQQSFPPNVTIVQEVASGELDNDRAMPLALILNELLTNAVKHGCTGAVDCQIRVGLEHRNDFELYVEDAGPGFDFHAARSRSSGLKLVELLARQVGGQLEVTTDPATRCTIRFN